MLGERAAELSIRHVQGELLMGDAEEEWYCRIDGQIEGPLTPRALKTRAAIGEIIPTDEVRKGLMGNWQQAKLVSGLQFASATRIITPELRQPIEKATPPFYTYKMVQIPPTIAISERTPKESAAARYLETLVNEEASNGWEFIRVDAVGVRVQPGCLVGLLIAFSGQSIPTETYYVVTFRKLAEPRGSRPAPPR